ncbi:hypothetical protein ACQKWADRAFT_323460 [Trichoderma austrokoningii]
MFSITSFVVFLAINWLSRIVFLDTKSESSAGPSLPFQSPAPPGLTPLQTTTTTYTTAGTVYHPGPPQRLQPPTRRGRLFKEATSEFDGLNLANPPHPTIHQLPEALQRLFLSDKADKADKAAQSESPIPDQHISYEPLQQNYDRAVSPPNDQQDQDQDQTPKMSWSVGAPPFVPLSKGKAIAADMGSSDDEECIMTSALMSMPVKSLQNLASYPNPNQKGAQKVLLQGMKPLLNDTLNGGTLNGTFNSNLNGGTLNGTFNSNLNGGTLNGTLSGPPGLDAPSLYRSESPVVPVGRYLPPHMRARLQASFSDPAVSRYPATSWETSRAAASETAATCTSSSCYSTPSAHSDISDLYMQTSLNLATGVGAPKPLTAGPPGLRQYRPSTFESTFKALNNTTPVVDSQHGIAYGQPEGGIAYGQPENGIAYGQPEDDDYPHLDPLCSLTETRPMSQDYIEQDEEFMPPFGWSSSKTVDAPPATRPNDDFSFCPRCLTLGDSPYCHPYAEDPEPDDVDELQPPRLPSGLFDEDSDDGIENEQGSYYYDNPDHWTPIDSYPPEVEPWPTYDFQAFREPTAPMFPQCMGHPLCVTEAEVQERNRQLNLKWYASTGLLGEGYICPEPIFEPTYPPPRKNIYGAVGDGRPSSKTRVSCEEKGESSSAGGNMPSEFSKNQKTYNELDLLGASLNRAAPGEWSEEEANAAFFQ